MGPSPKRIKSVGGALSSGQAERSRGRGGWRQRKLGNFNGLREQPKVLCRKHSEKPQIRRFCAGHAASELPGSAPCSEIATMVRVRWIAYPPWGKGVIAQRPIIIAPCM